MSMQLHDIGSERPPSTTTGGEPSSAASCTATALPSPTGVIIVLRVVGEIDLLTVGILQGGLDDSLARGPCDLVVDLTEMTFCSVRGIALLTQAGVAAAGQGAGYAVSGASRHLARVWAFGWPAMQLPTRYADAAAACLALTFARRRVAPVAVMPGPPTVVASLTPQLAAS